MCFNYSNVRSGLHVHFFVKIWVCKRYHNTIWSKKTCERPEWCTNSTARSEPHGVIGTGMIRSKLRQLISIYQPYIWQSLPNRPLPFYEVHEAVCRCLHLVAFWWLFDAFWLGLVRVYHEAQGQHLHCPPCHLRLSATTGISMARYLHGFFPIFFRLDFRPLQTTEQQIAIVRYP